MQWWIGTYRFVEALRLALLIEEGILVCLVDQEVKLKVAPRELHAARDRRPLAEGNRPVIRSAVGEGIPTDDVLLEHVAQALYIVVTL